jgi:vacuolar-type H+-ATPase subunit F/Vma7
MSLIVALGEAPRVRGFALGGATVVVADGAAELTSAWQSLEPGVGLVLLTAAAARALAPHLEERPHVLTVVMP